jgi:hypothetical protein
VTAQLATLEETVVRVHIEELKLPLPDVASETVPVGEMGVPAEVSEMVTVQVEGEPIETGDGVQVTAVEVARRFTVRPK